MPAGDGTGPFGTGPFGRGLGPCGRGRYFVNRMAGPGYGMGMAYRRGWRSWDWPRWGMGAVDPLDEKTALENQQSWLKSELERVTNLLAGQDKPPAE